MTVRGKSLLILTFLAMAVSSIRGEMTVSSDAYRDKLQGMWLGELIGNYAGRDREGWVQREGLNYAVDWNAATADSVWDGDDDTCFEFLYADVLNANPDPTGAQIGQQWLDHIAPNSFYIANRQARQLIGQGKLPPASGSINWNMHWYAIDSQITTESIGAMAPGMRQRAADLAGRFGSVSNDGFAVHAAQFYAAMYAAAVNETNVEQLVDKGLAVVPRTSRTYQIINDVKTWYQEDKQDGQFDWRATQAKIYDRYYGSQSQGRYYMWIESSANTAMTTLALLYGQGDFKQTVEIGVDAGFDADCNPATAGGIIGLMKGYSGLPADLMAASAGTYQASGWLVDMSRTRTISTIVDGLQQAAEGQILLSGGTITGSGTERTYHLPADNILAPVEKPDPTGPAGLVGKLQSQGVTVTVSASVERHDTTSDLRNLDAIIDGIKDVTYNGHRAYMTEDGITAQPAGGDFYQLNFSKPVVFNKVYFYEGDLAWGNINAYPQNNPAGGFFTDLMVEVAKDGVFKPVSNLHFSEPLDPYKFYQNIEMTFDPLYGEAVRIRGTAGGSYQFTTILELEAYGAVTKAGDCDLNGVVDISDLTLMGTNWNHDATSDGGESWATGDFNADGSVDIGDLSLMGANWNWSDPFLGGNDIPEPTTALLLAGGVAGIVLRRRRRTR